jgi:hypothetical protein
MTTGTSGSTVFVGPYKKYYFGGWGQPKAGISIRTWDGADGRDHENEYDCKWINYYEGTAYAGRLNTLRWVYPPGYWDRTPICENDGNYSFYVFSMPDIPHAVTGLAELPALDKLISGILNHEFQLNVTLGEAPESLVYIWRRLKPLIKSLRHLRKGDLLRAARALNIRKIKKLSVQAYLKITQNWTAYWLEYRYAIMPIISDVNNAMEYIDSKIGPPVSARIRKGSRVNLVPPNVYMAPYMGALQYWPDRTMIEYASVGVTLMEDFDYEKVDFRNPWTVIWDLLPFSFIVDWAINIGHYLRARWFFTFALYSRGFRTSFLKYDSGFYAGGYIPLYKPCNFDESDARKSFKTVDIVRRRKLDMSSVPLPRFRNPLSEVSHWKRVVDSFAILSSLAEGSNRKYRL